MPWENIGACGNGDMPHDRDWIIHCYQMARSYLISVLGDPPPGCKIGIMWHEHELGEYPSLGLHWDSPQPDVPWSFFHKCETLLERFDDAVDWSAIDPDAVAETLGAEFGIDEDEEDDDMDDEDDEDY